MISTSLKSALKTVSPVGAVNVTFQPGKVIASDSEMSITTALDHDFEFTVQSKLLSSVVSKLSGELNIQVGKKLTLKSSRAKYEIPLLTVPPQVFPSSEGGGVLPKEVLAPALSFACTAADPKGLWDYTGSIRVMIEPGMLKVFGSNGHRLAFFTGEIKGGWKEEFLIPYRTAQAITQLSGDVHASQSENVMTFSSGGTVIQAKRAAKEVVNFEKFIPTSFKHLATLKAEEVRASLDKIQPMVPGEEYNHAVQLTVLPDKLHVLTASAGGRAEDEVPFEADAFNDTATFKLGFNHRYLTDFFSAVQGEVTFKANGNGEPALFEAGSMKLMLASLTPTK